VHPPLFLILQSTTIATIHNESSRNHESSFIAWSVCSLLNCVIILGKCVSYKQAFAVFFKAPAYHFNMPSSYEVLVPNHWLGLCFIHEDEFYMSFEAEMVCFTLAVFVDAELK